MEFFHLTADNFSFFTYNWSFFAYSFSFFTYSWSFFAYSGKVHLIRALRDCKQRSLTVSKKAPTVSKKASPHWLTNRTHRSGSLNGGDPNRGYVFSLWQAHDTPMRQWALFLKRQIKWSEGSHVCHFFGARARMLFPYKCRIPPVLFPLFEKCPNRHDVCVPLPAMLSDHDHGKSLVLEEHLMYTSKIKMRARLDPNEWGVVGDGLKERSLDANTLHVRWAGCLPLN